MAFLALFVGYLLGSIPTAHLVARVKTGRDLRSLGGGNVGALNTLRTLGWRSALVVGLADVSKGALAVVLAHYLFRVDATAVWLAGTAAVAGHNWMVWLRFRGGKGMAAAIGVVGAVSFVYGFPEVFLIFIGVILVTFLAVHNVVLGNALALFALPLVEYLVTHSARFTAMAALLLAVIVIKFAPTAIADLRRRGFKGLGRDEYKAGKATRG